jgi:hypothetical protein
MKISSVTPVDGAKKVADREAQRVVYKKTSRWKLFQQTLEKEMKARKLNEI